MKSYIKFLSRNKLYTLIEAVGLAVSLAFVIIIGNYAYQQMTISTETEGYENIYTFGMSGGRGWPGLTYAFTGELKDRIPEVEAVGQFARESLALMVHGTSVSAQFIAADEGFFEIFPQYEFISGTPDMLVGHNVFVSETFANTHSIEVGESLDLYGHELTVAGIVRDFERTLVKYGDVIMNSKTFILDIRGYNPYDQFGSVITFARLIPGTDRETFHSKVDALCREIYPTVYGSMMFESTALYRLDEIYFAGVSNSFDSFNRGDMKSLRALILVGVLLLLSAVFNYVNLNVALTGKRAKEMATRRLLGADRHEIFMKYIVESVAFTALCFFFAVLIAVAIVPVINVLLNNPDVPLHLSFSAGYVVTYILLVLVTGTVVGLAPAVLASRFKPVEVIKGSFRAKSKMTFSKVFIVMQNTLAVFLLAMALVMEAQYSKSLDRPMHCNIQDMYYLSADGSFSNSAVEDALLKLPCVKRVGFSQGFPGYNPGGQFSLTREGDQIMYKLFRMDSIAFDMFGFEIQKDFGAPKYNSVWFGESAFKATGFDDEYHDISNTLAKRTYHCEQVAGVITDFPNNPTNIGSEDYMAISYMKKEDMWSGGFVIETAGDRKEAERQIKAACDECFRNIPVYVYVSSYMDDWIVRQMEPTRNNMKLIEIFMMLSIIISLLGLVAMSTYYASETAKDIAVKKVFGGTVESETFASVRKYMILVFISMLIGLPAAVWAAGKYLEQFIWKLDGYWWTFVAAALLTVLFAFGSVIFQTLKAARTNPAKELKKE